MGAKKLSQHLLTLFFFSNSCNAGSSLIPDSRSYKNHQFDILNIGNSHISFSPLEMFYGLVKITWK